MDVSPEESSGETEPGLESSLRRKRKGKPKAKGDGIRSRARACACGAVARRRSARGADTSVRPPPRESAAPLATIPFSFFCGGKETSRKRGGERIPAGRRARLGDAERWPRGGGMASSSRGRPAHARESSGGMAWGEWWRGGAPARPVRGRGSLLVGRGRVRRCPARRCRERRVAERLDHMGLSRRGRGELPPA